MDIKGVAEASLSALSKSDLGLQIDQRDFFSDLENVVLIVISNNSAGSEFDCGGD